MRRGAKLGLLGAILFTAAIGATTDAVAGHGDGGPEFRVEITNITPGQWFSPLVVYTHGPDHALFELGLPASDEVAALAEAGMTEPLRTWLESSRTARDVAVAGGLTPPGQTTTLTVRARRVGSPSAR